MFNSTEVKFIMLIDTKMQTSVDILTVISMINTTSEDGGTLLDAYWVGGI